ncbi:uncharacterized protein LOC143284493 [Babylonia areolata]|uniref:uncharacterized protein LOC143284493 n=1 Tax=Babylonia areolata TaxID=304850 RepID=UPI003FD60BB0
MLTGRVVLLIFTVLCTWMESSDSCQTEMVSRCPNYDLLIQLRIIPLPDPDRLSNICEKLQEGIQCLLGPSILGKCDASARTKYTSILNVLQYPCFRQRAEYRAGRLCWRSSDLQAMMSMCYMKNQAAIDDDYCIGQLGFINCTTTDILNVPNCGLREQSLLNAMVTRNYNDNGLVMRPPCQEKTLKSSTTTTTTTTTTTPSTTTSTTTTTTPSTTTTPDTTTTTTTTTTTASGSGVSARAKGDSGRVSSSSSSSGSDTVVLGGMARSLVLCMVLSLLL